MRNLQRFRWTSLLTGGAILLLASAILRAETKLDFNSDIRPILSDRCFHCHGPDGADRKADLRLDIREDAQAETSTGLQAIHPGKAELSEVIQRIHATDPDELMPPPASKISLTPAEKETLTQWINEGAEYAPHWAFRPLEETAIPQPKHTQRLRNPIDHFIQARLEQEGWSLSEDASKEQLTRRVSYDITGLPPSADADEPATQKPYETLVDDLLESEHYGERMAAEWLDVARYSDSYGYQVDRDRFVWPWRDWVIKAFNDNLAYDKFITWQLAGDLLPNATPARRVIELTEAS